MSESLMRSRKRFGWEPPREAAGDAPRIRNQSWDGEDVGPLQWAVLCWLQVTGSPASTAELSEGAFAQWEENVGVPTDHVGYIDWSYGGVYQACIRLERRGFVERVTNSRGLRRSDPRLGWKLIRSDPEIDRPYDQGAS